MVLQCSNRRNDPRVLDKSQRRWQFRPQLQLEARWRRSTRSSHQRPGQRGRSYLAFDTRRSPLLQRPQRRRPSRPVLPSKMHHRRTQAPDPAVCGIGLTSRSIDFESEFGRAVLTQQQRTASCRSRATPLKQPKLRLAMARRRSSAWVSRSRSSDFATNAHSMTLVGVSSGSTHWRWMVRRNQ